MAKSKNKSTKRKLSTAQIVFYVMCVLIVASMLVSLIAK